MQNYWGGKLGTHGKVGKERVKGVCVCVCGGRKKEIIILKQSTNRIVVPPLTK